MSKPTILKCGYVGCTVCDPDPLTQPSNEDRTPGFFAQLDAMERNGEKFNVADMQGNPIPDKVIEGGPFVTPRSFSLAALLMDEFDKASKKSKRATADFVLNRLPLPGLGKSKLMKKWLKKDNKKRKRKGLPKLKLTAWKLAKFEPEDLTGFIVPPWFKPSVAVRDTSGSIPPQTIKDFVDEIEKVTQPGKWDLKDQDGDVHSPAWYLDAYLIARDEYHKELSTDMRGMTPEQDTAHIGLLDELLVEMNMYGTFVNRLFGSDKVEGEWNHAEDEDVSE